MCGQRGTRLSIKARVVERGGTSGKWMIEVSRRKSIIRNMKLIGRLERVLMPGTVSLDKGAGLVLGIRDSLGVPWRIEG